MKSTTPSLADPFNVDLKSRTEGNWSVIFQTAPPHSNVPVWCSLHIYLDEGFRSLEMFENGDVIGDVYNGMLMYAFP